MNHKAHQLYVTVVQLGKSLLGSKVIFTIYSQEKKKMNCWVIVIKMKLGQSMSNCVVKGKK